MRKLYVVRLSFEERARLRDLARKGRAAAHKRRHAHALLPVDRGEHGPGHSDRVAADRAGMAVRTVERLRERCVREGLEAALERRRRSRECSRVLDGEAEARLVAVACSEPPEGCARWTLHLLADEMKRLRVVETVSHETVRRVLKKRRQALAAGDVAHCAQGGRGVRVRDGAGP
jgi:transposase